MLKNRVAVVTGGASGIGRAISLDLARNHAKVAINFNKSETKALELVKEIKSFGGEAICIQANLEKESDVKRLIKEIVNKWNGIDIVVNSAGIMKDNFIEDIPLEEWREVLEVNLSSIFLICREAIPYLKKSGSGRIISISSQAAFRGSSRHTHYAATKAGILGFTFSLAKELGKDNITANVVSPGRIKTEMIEKRIENREANWLEETPLGRLGTPNEIAYMVSFLASDKASYITGANIHINGGLYMG